MCVSHRNISQCKKRKNTTRKKSVGRWKTRFAQDLGCIELHIVTRYTSTLFCCWFLNSDPVRIVTIGDDIHCLQVQKEEKCFLVCPVICFYFFGENAEFIGIGCIIIESDSSCTRARWRRRVRYWFCQAENRTKEIGFLSLLNFLYPSFLCNSSRICKDFRWYCTSDSIKSYKQPRWWF